MSDTQRTVCVLPRQPETPENYHPIGHVDRKGSLTKGETSGHLLHVEAILVDCDQDALVLKVRPAGPACHTGERSCFYRALEGDALTRLDG